MDGSVHCKGDVFSIYKNALPGKYVHARVRLCVYVWLSVLSVWVREHLVGMKFHLKNLKICHSMEEMEKRKSWASERNLAVHSGRIGILFSFSIWWKYSSFRPLVAKWNFPLGWLWIFWGCWLLLAVLIRLTKVSSRASVEIKPLGEYPVSVYRRMGFERRWRLKIS